jgi:two-component system sensor histidine kinase/response regulator
MPRPRLTSGDLNVADQPDSSFDRADLMQRLDDDLELISELVQIFLEDAPQLVEELGAAIARGDAVQVNRSAHSLKGSASNFSAGPVVASASRLEQMGKAGDLDLAAIEFETLEANLRALEIDLKGLIAEGEGPTP